MGGSGSVLCTIAAHGVPGKVENYDGTFPVILVSRRTKCTHPTPPTHDYSKAGDCPSHQPYHDAILIIP